MKFGQLDSVDNVKFQLPPITQFTLDKLNSLSPNSETLSFYLGTSVWGDKSYLGTLYPKGTKQKDFLKVYASQFNAIEVNATRYGMPKMETIQKWADTVPDNFRFSFKMPQVITHRKNMVDNDALKRLDDFLVKLYQVSDKVGTTFMLMPNYFKLDKLDNLQELLRYIPVDFKVALEVRNAEFHQNDEVLSTLNSRNIPLVITDTPGEREVVHQLLTADSLFVRFAGAGLHPSDYYRIDQWIDRMLEWIEKGLKTVYFFIHEPAPNKYQSGILAAYMVKKLNEKMPQINLQAPVNYASN